MTTQTDIFGGETVLTGTDTAETAKILETYPAAAGDPGMFAFLILKKRCPWIAQLDESKQHQLRQFARDWPSLNRRRQEARERLEKGLPLRP